MASVYSMQVCVCCIQNRPELRNDCKTIYVCSFTERSLSRALASLFGHHPRRL